MMVKQLILFGSPGVGKSYYIDKELLPSIGVDPASGNCIKTVFHPEYTYGDFVGKLLPITKDDKVQYNFYEGHFLRALAKAYRCILDNPEAPANVALVIDELNRGNSAAIFGSVFQLLDRDTTGWSSYYINISQMEFERLISLMGIVPLYENKTSRDPKSYRFNGKEFFNLDDLLSPTQAQNSQVRIPSNLFLFATINTSDTSIYYMDSAFKRRWDWGYIDIESTYQSSPKIIFADREQWKVFVRKLNQFVQANSGSVRNVEDKQIGYWFIASETISLAQIQNKLLFFLWDSVFSRDRRPLAELLKLKTDQLVTFGDFVTRAPDFIQAILSRQ